jgi:hypothetical protein
MGKTYKEGGKHERAETKSYERKEKSMGTEAEYKKTGAKKTNKNYKGKY